MSNFATNFLINVNKAVNSQPTAPIEKEEEEETRVFGTNSSTEKAEHSEKEINESMELFDEEDKHSADTRDPVMLNEFNKDDFVIDFKGIGNLIDAAKEIVENLRIEMHGGVKKTAENETNTSRSFQIGRLMDLAEKIKEEKDE